MPPGSSPSATAPAGASDDCQRRARRRRSRRHRAGALAVVLALILTATAVTDAAVLARRPSRVELAVPTARGAPETWLVVGLDSRESVPAGPNYYGSTAEVPGERADVVALIQEDDAGMTVLILPRDLTLVDADGRANRLATSYLDGPQATVDLLCTALGIPATHLITVDMAQFAQIVDSLGGVEVSIPEPMRDAYSGLNLSITGTQRLNGTQALALVRSRHPEVLRDGVWTALGEVRGAQQRSEYTGLVMRAVMESIAATARTPWTAHSLAHTTAGNLTIDDGTGVIDLYRLARSLSGDGDVDVLVVPVPQGDTIIALPDEQTYAVLSDHGYTPGSCTPADPGP